MKTRVFSALLVIGFMAMPALSNATSVAIVNPSFEGNALQPADYIVNMISGWIISSGEAGTWYPASITYYPSVPNGVNIAYSNGGTISQTLTTALANDTTYTLNVEVGHRSDGYFNNYTIQLLAGPNVIASVINPIDPGPGNFGLATLSYTSAVNDANAGQLLGIRFLTAGAQVNYDAVSLTTSAVPVPAAVWFFGSGLIGLVGLRRKAS